MSGLFGVNYPELVEDADSFCTGGFLSVCLISVL